MRRSRLFLGLLCATLTLLLTACGGGGGGGGGGGDGGPVDTTGRFDEGRFDEATWGP